MMQFTPDQIDCLVVIATVCVFTAGWQLFGGGLK